VVENHDLVFSWNDGSCYCYYY